MHAILQHSYFKAPLFHYKTLLHVYARTRMLIRIYAYTYTYIRLYLYAYYTHFLVNVYLSGTVVHDSSKGSSESLSQ